MNELAAPLGDEEVRALEPALHRYARRAVSDPEIAAELVQDALAAALTSRASFEGRSKLRTWVIGILSHKVSDYFRRAQRRVARTSEIDPDLLETAPSDRPDMTLARKQALDVLEAALPTLSENERLAVLMVDVEGLDRSEACNVLGVEPTHLRVLLHRGRNRLRRALENAELSPDS